MLSLAEPRDTLVREVQRRIKEASEENVAVAPRLQATFDEIDKDAYHNSQPKNLTTEAETNLRDLLLDVLEWHHWHSQRTYSLRPMQRIATNRIVFAEVIAFLFLVAPFAFIYGIEYWYGSPPSFANWAGLPLYLVLSAGLFGAFFSRMQWLQSNWDSLSLSQVRDAMDWRSIRLRGAVGMGGALIVYFFLQSGLVGGDLFPQLPEFNIGENWSPHTKDGQPLGNFSFHLFQPSPALALLVVWSFIAGFSERFVPGILAATETSLGSAASAQRK